MTAVTPGREELLDLAHSLDLCARGHMGLTSDIKAVKDAAALMRRLAAKPADARARARLRLLDWAKKEFPRESQEYRDRITADIGKALSPAGAPKP